MNSSATVTGCDDIIRRLREAIAEHPLSPIHGYAADITDLLDRLDDFEENGAQAVRWAPSSAHWSNELRRLFGPSAREGIESLEAKFRDATVRLDKAEREIERLRSESKAQLEELGRIDDALGTNEGPSAVDHVMILKTENERLRAERDEHARWRAGLADKLHDAESQISAAWAALRHAGIQSEETIAEAIALLRAENERLAAELANLQIAFNDWKVMHSTVRLEVENERLRKFAGNVLEKSREEFLDLSCGDIEDWAKQCGLLEQVEMTAACGDDCQCAEWADFPLECLRPTALGSAAIDAAREKENQS